MDLPNLHEQLAGVPPAVLSGDAGALAGIEAHASEGCSRCGRALVNARDAAVSLAQAAPSVEPRAGLRDRILARAREHARGPRTALVDVRGSAGTSPAPPRAPRRIFDPAGELARLHIGGPGDAERTLEVDALGVASPAEDDASARMLAQIQRLIRFPLLFVSVVRGDRCGYRTQVGLPEGVARDRRRETTFCTHTVSTGEPMVVTDAASEPFFRGSTMVLREGIRAYAGVPLRTSRGILVGNVCAMDYVPRRIGPEVVRTLELYAEPIVAEMERARGGPPWPRTAAGALLHPARWFRELAELTEGAMLVAEGTGAEALADLCRPDEPVGRLAERDLVGLLVPGSAGPDGEDARRDELGEAVRGMLTVARPPFAKLFR